ncbi:MAG: metallophosphoesterase [Clostridia bacterium]|nr:metallophosphoesterase [Clostridia bacterium]
MKKGKIIKIIICVLLVVLIAGGAIAYSQLPHPLNYKIKDIEPLNHDTVTITADDTDSVTLQKNDGGPFRILLLTDMHLDGKNKTSNVTIGNMIAAIQKENPDLVLLGGDNVTSAFNTKRSHQLAEIFEKLGVYWGGILGNHEGDNPYSITREKMVDIFSSYDRCIMRKGVADIDGNCNYAINLLDKDGNHLETIFCLDTFDELNDEQIKFYNYTGDRTPYDGAHENQVEWFKNKAAALKKDYGDEYKSIMLMHIPLPEMGDAAEEGNFYIGDKQEGVCSTVFNIGLFDAMKEAGVSAAYFGHDHKNNFGVEVDGIKLCYLETSGYGSYGFNRDGLPESEWLQGYSILEILPDTDSFTQYRYYDALK